MYLNECFIIERYVIWEGWEYFSLFNYCMQNIWLRS